MIRRIFLAVLLGLLFLSGRFSHSTAATPPRLVIPGPYGADPGQMWNLKVALPSGVYIFDFTVYAVGMGVRVAPAVPTGVVRVESASDDPHGMGMANVDTLGFVIDPLNGQAAPAAVLYVTITPLSPMITLPSSADFNLHIWTPSLGVLTFPYLGAPFH